MIELNSITGLDVGRFERARRQAEDQIRASVPEPDRAKYTGRSFSKYPPAVTFAALVALGIVAVAMFWISAGKALVAADLTLGPMVGEYARLSPAWLDTALVLFLLAGEVGTLIFTCGRALLGVSGGDRIWLTIAALACAGGALLANVSVTALHPENTAGVMTVFGWFMAIMPPALVLAVGLFVERLLLGSLENRAAARSAYESAMREWRAAQQAPADHPEYRRFWYLSILDQLQRISTTNRNKIQAAIEADPGVRIVLVARELRRHEWAEGAITVAELPRVEHIERPALGAPVQPDAEPDDGRSLNTLNSPAFTKALSWLQSQPERPSNVRHAAELAGVSVGTMHAAFKAWQQSEVEQ